VYGRYQFSETWGAEFNYADWGRPAGATGKSTAQSLATQSAASPSLSPDVASRGSQLDLSATGTVPLMRGLSLTGKLGYGRHELGASPYCLSAACGPLAGGRSEGTRAGVGLRYSFSDNWGVRLDYENVNTLSSPNALPAKGDNWSARIKYTF
jgi:opacity protein-like surface antigen